MGVLCHLCGSSIIGRASCGRSFGCTAREQVDDGNIHDRLCWSNDLFHLQGLLLSYGPRFKLLTPFYQLIKVLTLNNTDQYRLVWKSLTVFCTFINLLFLLFFHIITAVIAIVLLVTTFVLSVIVLRNFGRGLMEACMYPKLFSFNHLIFYHLQWHEKQCKVLIEIIAVLART